MEDLKKPQSGAPRDLICCQGSYHNVAMEFDEYHQQDGLDSVRCNDGTATVPTIVTAGTVINGILHQHVL